MSIQLRNSKRSLAKERSEQIFLDIPAKFRDVIEPFLNQDLAIDVGVEGTKTVFVLTRREGTKGNSN
jgi:hypothetical protein